MPKNSWLPQAILYQIFTGRWEEPQKDSNESTFQWLKHQQWENLLDLGINTIYFLGLFEHEGPIMVNEEHQLPLASLTYPRVPSLFALTNHQSINSRFGTQTQFEELVSVLHNHNARVIVDFIPNHTATTHPWVTTHPQYYVHRNGNFVAEFSGDVYKLDYSNPDLCQAMLEVLQRIAGLGVDGVRCDMAHLIPQAFWQASIGKIKALNPDFVFVAEAYPNSLFDYSNITALYTAGFDAIYNNGLYENMYKVIVEDQPLSFLTEYLKAQPINHQGLTINYFFNHDDPPLKNWEQEEKITQLSDQFFEALLGMSLFAPGIPFIYNGSLCGLNHRLGHHWLEMLPSNQTEIRTPIDPVISRLLKCRKQFLPEINTNPRVFKSQDNLLIISTHNFVAAFNLTRRPLEIPSSLKSAGFIHGLQVKDQLVPGHMEIWTRHEE